MFSVILYIFSVIFLILSVMSYILSQAYFLKHPCTQCNSSLNTIFLPLFNFTLITCHNIMACNLEWHAIATKGCFGMQQPYMQWFL